MLNFILIENWLYSLIHIKFRPRKFNLEQQIMVKTW